MSIFDVKTTYTREKIAQRCADLREKTTANRLNVTPHYYIFVDMNGQQGHFGRGGALAHPALSVHDYGADVTWLTDADIETLRQDADHTVTEEYL